MSPAVPSSVYTAHVASQFSAYAKDRNFHSRDAIYMMSNGVSQPHPYETQRVGENGPLLLQDFHLIDLLYHFDRERIPERVCPVTVLFSTVGGESGSHDLARDPRGFVIKFRTDDGNWDLVANNTPVFFLRDPAKFPHFIHSQKRDPSTHLTSADDSTMFWDYLCNNPESVHQVMILLDDRGIPDGFRFMHGYSGHTLKLVNKDDDMQGAKFITQEDSAKHSPDYSQKELYSAIARGDFPRWTGEVQTMTPAQAEDVWAKQGINVFDLTHVWPQVQFPRTKVGEFALNENAVNYFAEIEQIAFNPAHMPPGIEPSAEPVLQSRLFSYPDTHRHRVGVNYQQLPVNAPRTSFCPANFQGARPSYLSSIEPIRFRERTVDLSKTHGHFIGEAIKFLSEIRPEDFNARANTAGKMALCREEEFLRRQITIFREVDPDIATRLEKATGVKGYDGIAGLGFNCTHNGMAIDSRLRYANGISVEKGSSRAENNGAPAKGTHKYKGGEGAAGL
ncbi:catalase-like domain-containing protein [Schizothecium vesticola]|uniref:Catalase-like domain-containing protein n=1 Tax=Schizothecium vesticola TaxID=314040 RepID=A0AA40FB87_9PEZI|nr:catalase-like domain-containing protein [Schizothecium vesticola]